VRTLNIGKKLLLVTAATLAIAIPVAVGIVRAVPIRGAQSSSARRPEFEVASIKRNASGNNAAEMSLTAGRLSVQRTTVQNLILFAYDVRPFQLSRAPSWMNSDRYDIEARAHGNATREQMKLMLQTLLESRFGLRLHRETTEQTVLALTVAKSGIKMRLFKEGSCIPPDDPSHARLPLCGNSESGKGLRRDLHATNIDMATLARMLSFDLQSPVIDRTGLSSDFVIHLSWSPASTAAIPVSGDDAGDPGRPTADQTSGPSLYAALQEQLGLKLESAKGPVEVLVIDRLDRPSEN